MQKPQLSLWATDGHIGFSDTCLGVPCDEPGQALGWRAVESLPEVIADEVAIEAGEFDVPKVSIRNTLNDLSGREWIAETKSVWFQKGLGAGHEHAQIERQHPAPFSFQDVSRLIRFFTKHAGRVLDPFLGVGSTLKACALTGRIGVGIELVDTWAALSRLRLIEEVGLDSVEHQTILHGDSREVLSDHERFPNASFDFVVTSPPYWRILGKRADHKVKAERLSHGLAVRYSDDDPRDLGNLQDYEDFLAEVSKVFAQCKRVLKPGKYLAIIVGDFRHGGQYISYHSDLIARLTDPVQGFELHGINILVQNQKRLYPYGYPSTYVPNLHHQYILMLRNPKSQQRVQTRSSSVSGLD